MKRVIVGVVVLGVCAGICPTEMCGENRLRLDEATINGQPAQLAVDTGAEMSFLFRSRSRISVLQRKGPA